jgi:hypothetical protein
MRDKKRLLIQKALRCHGLRYEPDEWPSASTLVRIAPDPSVVGGGRRTKDNRLEALLPRWLEPDRFPPSSRDPLGLLNTTKVTGSGYVTRPGSRLNQARSHPLGGLTASRVL